MYRLELTDDAAPLAGSTDIVPAALLDGYARFCTDRFAKASRVTLALETEAGELLGWVLGVEAFGRLDALPDRMYGFVRAGSPAPIDLDGVWKALRREYGGKFNLFMPPEALSGPVCASVKGKVARYHAHDTFLMHCADVDAAWSGVERVGRQGVAKAEREGVRVSMATDGAAFMRYLGLHVAKSSRLGSPAMRRQDIDLLRTLFGPNLGLSLALVEDRPIAAVLFLTMGSYAMLIDNASLPEHWHLNPNNLVVWKAVEECITRGATTVDFGFSTAEDEGARRFKAHMGARPHPVFLVTAG
jgi:hypothetical protein